MTNTVQIYGLRCPVRNEIMYVGKSVDVSARVAQHIAKAKKGVDLPKHRWIRSLIEIGLSPAIEILDTCDPDSSWRVESEWIKKCKVLNPDLTNLTYKERGRRNKKQTGEGRTNCVNTEDSVSIKLNIHKSLKLLEAKNGRDYTIKDIAEKSTLHRHTVSSLLEGRDDPTVRKVLQFFESEGMPITPNDLFIVQDTE